MLHFKQCAIEMAYEGENVSGEAIPFSLARFAPHRPASRDFALCVGRYYYVLLQIFRSANDAALAVVLQWNTD